MLAFDNPRSQGLVCLALQKAAQGFDDPLTIMTVQARFPMPLRLAAGLVLLTAANIACALEVGFLRLERQEDGSFRETVVAQAGFAPLEPGIAREL